MKIAVLVTSMEVHQSTEMLNQLQVVVLDQVEDHKVLEVQLQPIATPNPLHRDPDQTPTMQTTATFRTCPSSDWSLMSVSLPPLWVEFHSFFK